MGCDKSVWKTALKTFCFLARTVNAVMMLGVDGRYLTRSCFFAPVAAGDGSLSRFHVVRLVGELQRSQALKLRPATTMDDAVV